MKQVRNFILMSVMLLMGSVCWAQETEVRDGFSIWDVNINSLEDNTVVTFFTMPNHEGSWSVEVKVFTKDNNVIMSCSMFDYFSKSDWISCEVIDSSTVKISVSFPKNDISKDEYSYVIIEKMYETDLYRRKAYTYFFDGKLTEVPSVENNFERKYFLLSGVELKEIPYHTFFIEKNYINGQEVLSQKKYKN